MWKGEGRPPVMLDMSGGSRERHHIALLASGGGLVLFSSRRRKGCGWAGIGPKDRVVVCFARLARQGEEREMGWLHSRTGPNAIRPTGKNRYLFQILAAEVNKFKMNLNLNETF
jgi:hypothetical protein